MGIDDRCLTVRLTVPVVHLFAFLEAGSPETRRRNTEPPVPVGGTEPLVPVDYPNHRHA
jgi:hypothetical protein